MKAKIELFYEIKLGKASSKHAEVEPYPRKLNPANHTGLIDHRLINETVQAFREH